MRSVLAIISIATSFVAGARADTKGVIGGRVTDSQNAAVAQAVIELTNDKKRWLLDSESPGRAEYRKLGD